MCILYTPPFAFPSVPSHHPFSHQSLHTAHLPFLPSLPIFSLYLSLLPFRFYHLHMSYLLSIPFSCLPYHPIPRGPLLFVTIPFPSLHFHCLFHVHASVIPNIYVSPFFSPVPYLLNLLLSPPAFPKSTSPFPSSTVTFTFFTLLHRS